MNGQPPSVPPVNPPSSKPPKTLGSAIARLVFYGGVFIMILFMWSEMRPPNAQEKERARAIQCISNVKSISLACAMYAKDNDGKLPRNFDDLKGVITSTKIFICPSAKDKTHYSYAFTGTTNKWQDAPDVVILREIEANHSGRRTLLFNDGHVEQRKD